ncbi:serine protease [Rhodococcus ruber Chol-4]|uniref:Putative enzyme n=1 Tax=Rhodococcus ruber TaxID=1830 RepID=A0A098BS10_9NOCA|nr:MULTISPECIES: MarP family serine protease [Rhodococcus]MDO2377473.1 MarP family serine protease [Rhodococcus ruber]RIK12168.1 MAG: serine protease [Acidobacteriota bacterium]ATQ30582.1 serine protease [Rhodococcus ruber]AUM19655.1 serine protease [Rhodococcus ruber]AXY50217.1 serine protease [Rhodococcus ruber]
MTPSGWIDLLILLVVLVAASSGLRQGAVASALAFLGVVLGAVAGILIAPHVLVHVEEGRMRILAGIALIVVLVIIGEVAGMVLGRAARSNMHSPVARGVDSVVGAGLQAVAVLVAAWLLAIPLTASSQPEISAAVRGSRVLSTVDVLAPDWLRGVPKEFSALLDTSGLPDVIGPFGRTPVAEVEPPDPSVLASPVALDLHPSVLRINGIAPTCQRALEGSGFVVAPERVMTNAHVVAGTSAVSVQTLGGALDAEVVLFDPAVDVAILSVPGLDVAPLEFAPAPADSGQDALVLGYPGGGPYTASAARIRETLDLQGPDIYRSGTVEREVYTVRGSIRQGNSGGPLVDEQGRVLGVVFGAAVDNSDTGFVLTAAEVSSQLALADDSFAAVATGTCIA